MNFVRTAVPAGVAVLFLIPGAAAGAVTKTVGVAERQAARAAPIERIAREAKPLAIPQASRARLARQAPEVRSGPEVKVPGAQPAQRATPAAGTRDLATADGQNGPWTGGPGASPALQTGKLFFDVQPGAGERWSHCSATAVSSENKSAVMTAGHCIYEPDPDGDGVIDGNGYWFENVTFCPGYESGCKLGAWYARHLHTTASWAHGSSRSYDWSDDVAAVVVSPHPTKGYLVDAVGGQGVAFNIATGLDRHAFGYPVSDRRWPDYTYDGETLIYCPARDTSDAFGHLTIGCTMTGGASGGPWITHADADWLGYVNSVNSHKVDGGLYMSGPYFGAAESRLYQRARAS